MFSVDFEINKCIVKIKNVIHIVRFINDANVECGCELYFRKFVCLNNLDLMILNG